MTIKSVSEANGIKITDRRKISMGGGSKRSKSKVTHIARHHSGVNVDQTMEILEGFWKNTHKWVTGGYHVVIHFDGSVDWNYDYDVISNGVGDHNSYIFNISVLGNGKFTAEQERSFAIICKEVQRELNIPTNKVLGHKEFKGHESNACPGIDMKIVRAALNKTVENTNEDKGSGETTVAKLGKETMKCINHLTIYTKPTRDSKVLKTKAKDSSMLIEGYVYGEAVYGHNIWWYKVEGGYAFSGDFVPEIDQLYLDKSNNL